MLEEEHCAKQTTGQPQYHGQPSYRAEHRHVLMLPVKARGGLLSFGPCFYLRQQEASQITTWQSLRGAQR
jgi:hypothetical protein